MKKFFVSLLLGLATAVLLCLSFPTIDQGWIMLFALVPLLVVLYSPGPIWQKVLVSFVGFVAFFAYCMRWIRLVSWLGFPPLVLYLSMYPVLFSLAVALLSDERVVDRAWLRRWLPVLATPVAWIVFEWLRGTVLTGLPWLMLGHALHDTRIAQVADIAGCYGLSFLAAGINSAIAALVAHSLPDGSGTPPRTGLQRAYLGVWVIVCISCWGYGTHRLGEEETGVDFRIGVVQGNVKKNVKHHSDRAAQLLNVHLNLSRELSGCDLIVWPETCVPVSIEKHLSVRDGISRLAVQMRAYMLVGGIGVTGDDFYNSAFFVSPRGEFLGRYDKIHLVPFGEYIPLPWLLTPIVQSRVFYKKSFCSGKESVIFTAKEVPFGVLICFEDVFPDVVNRSVRNGAKLLLNITSEGWFGRDGELEQHLAIARLAAITHRTPMVRVTNTGLSAYIDSRGRVRTSPKLPPFAPGVDCFVVKVRK